MKKIKLLSIFFLTLLSISLVGCSGDFSGIDPTTHTITSGSFSVEF